MTDMTQEEQVARSDQTLRAMNFKTWLRDNRDREEFAALADLVLRSDSKRAREDDDTFFAGRKWLKFDFQEYTTELQRAGRPDLLDALFLAETEWRADNMAARGARQSMSLKDAESVSSKLVPMTAELPTIITQCGWKDASGAQCSDAALPGALRCPKHGGEWLDPAVRQRLLMASYMRLVESTEIAVDALVHVAANGRREEARVMAAKEILDRAGIRAGVDVHIHEGSGGGGSAQLDALRKRLDAMAESIEAREVLVTSALDIVDAEIVEEEDPNAPVQESLFDMEEQTV